jgi:hypothetical protein
MNFGTIMNDAICLPIFDGGNIGIRRRQVEAIFAGEASNRLSIKQKDMQIDEPDCL